MSDEKFEIRDRRNGNWFWCQIAVLRADIPKTVKLTYFVLCSYASRDTQKCYPGMRRIAEDANLSLRSVVSAIRILREAKFITATPRKGGLNEYTLLPVTRAKFALVQPATQNQCNSRHESSAPRVTKQYEGTKRKNNYGIEILRKKIHELSHAKSMPI